MRLYFFLTDVLQKVDTLWDRKLKKHLLSEKREEFWRAGEPNLNEFYTTFFQIIIFLTFLLNIRKFHLFQLGYSIVSAGLITALNVQTK